MGRPEVGPGRIVQGISVPNPLPVDDASHAPIHCKDVGEVEVAVDEATPWLIREESIGSLHEGLKKAFDVSGRLRARTFDVL